MKLRGELELRQTTQTWHLVNMGKPFHVSVKHGYCQVHLRGHCAFLGDYTGPQFPCGEAFGEPKLVWFDSAILSGMVQCLSVERHLWELPSSFQDRSVAHLPDD